jgi:hypothetical protein
LTKVAPIKFFLNLEQHIITLLISHPNTPKKEAANVFSRFSPPKVTHFSVFGVSLCQNI